MVVALLVPSETVTTADPAPTDVIVMEPGVVVVSAVATVRVSEIADVPTKPKTALVFAVEEFVEGVKVSANATNGAPIPKRRPIIRKTERVERILFATPPTPKTKLKKPDDFFILNFNININFF